MQWMIDIVNLTLDRGFTLLCQSVYNNNRHKNDYLFILIKTLYYTG